MSQLIRFKDLVNSNNKFKPCPNCGSGNVVTPRFGWDGLVIGDPFCKDCNHYFVIQKKKLFRWKKFTMMSAEEHDKMVHDMARGTIS